MKTKTTKQKEYGSFWYCSEKGCEDSGRMDLAGFKAHIEQVHGKKVEKDTKCHKRMTMHMDGNTWYSSQYDVELLGLKAVNSTCDKRTGEDAMYWGGSGE